MASSSRGVLMATAYTLAGLAFQPAAGQPTDPVEAAKREEARREALWAALFKACPKEAQDINVYAENDTLTQVCFRSGGRTMLFSLKTGKAEVVHHMKALPRGSVNRITYFSRGRDDGAFILWFSGKHQLTIVAGGE
jgi:hypothetical protein